MVNRKSILDYNLLFARLSGLQFNRHTRIADAFAFVRVGLAQLMYFSADLAELLLVDAGNRDGRLILLNASLGGHALSLCFNAFGQRKLNRVRIAKRKQ